MNDNDQNNNSNPAPNPTPDNNQNAGDNKADLEKQVSELKGQVDKMGEYVKDANTLINVVYSDPDIQKMVKQKYGGDQTPTEKAEPEPTKEQKPNTEQNAPAATPAPVTDPRVDTMDASLRAQYINSFDEKYGIGREESKEVHEKMGAELASLGLDIKQVPLDTVPSLLEKSFKLSHSDRYDKVVQNRGAAQTMTNMQGSVPSQGGGGNTESSETNTLTPEQKKWVNDLVTPSEKASAEQKAQEIVEKNPES